MPGLNGVETLAVLKANPEMASIPVIVLSLFSPEESDWPFADLAGWVQKPVVEQTLVDAIALTKSRILPEEFEAHVIRLLNSA